MQSTEEYSEVRTTRDLETAVRQIAGYFETEAVVIVGSQSVLVGWPTAPVLMRTSGEIDAYPANARDWEDGHNLIREASEEIAALFGQGSKFHARYGFYIDGVDDRTATLPPGWKERGLQEDRDRWRKFCVRRSPLAQTT